MAGPASLSRHTPSKMAGLKRWRTSHARKKPAYLHERARTGANEMLGASEIPSVVGLDRLGLQARWTGWLGGREAYVGG